MVQRLQRLHLMLTAKLSKCVRVSHMVLVWRHKGIKKQHLRLGTFKGQEGPLVNIL